MSQVALLTGIARIERVSFKIHPCSHQFYLNSFFLTHQTHSHLSFLATYRFWSFGFALQVTRAYPDSGSGSQGALLVSSQPPLILAGDYFTQSNLNGCAVSAQQVNLFFFCELIWCAKIPFGLNRSHLFVPVCQLSYLKSLIVFSMSFDSYIVSSQACDLLSSMIRDRLQSSASASGSKLWNRIPRYHFNAKPIC